MKTLETLIKKALTEINPESSYIEEPSKELTRPFLTQRVEVEKYIDHTHLKNDTTESFLRTFIEEGKRLHPASICIHPKWVRLCHQLLSKEDSSNSKVKTCTVIGFPLGTSPTEVKVLETKIAVNDGADEIDMVLSLSDLKDRKLATIHDEISQIRSACPNQILKVIIETCLLTKEEILIATLIC